MHGHSGSRAFGSRQRSPSSFFRRGGWGWWSSGGAVEEAPDSTAISTIQSCLARVIGPWVPQTGRLGRATRHALRRFQVRQGLPASGYPDARTVGQLKSECGARQASDVPDSVESPESASGEIAGPSSPSGCNEDRCTSEYIKWVQESLNQLGNRLRVTGVLDRTTINAINQFKSRNGVSPREYYASRLIEQALVKAGASAPPPVRKLPCGPTSTAQLLPLLRHYASDIPPEYLLGWITVESGGKVGDLTKICERGYFQVHPEEAQELGITDFDRLSTDPAASVEGGLKLVRRYAAGVKRVAAQFNFSPQGDLFWGLSKLQHWIPSAPSRILAQMRRDSVPVTDWQSIHNYVYSKSNLGFGSFNPREGVDSVSRYLASVSRWRSILAGGTVLSPPAFSPAARSTDGLASPSAKDIPFSLFEIAAVRSAIQQGQRDANKLTDLILNRRHPERRGQRLHPGESALVNEWLDIQAQLVLPALQAAA